MNRVFYPAYVLVGIMTDTPRYAVEATGTSIAILETLVESEGPLGVTALAERVGVSKSVAHNHLSTLRAHGYVIKSEGAYEPALRMLELGDRTRSNSAVYRAARPELDNLAAATGETTTLFVKEETRGVPIYVAEAEEGWSPPYREGERTPLHVNAPGKALMASLSEAQVDEILDAASLDAPTSSTVTDPDELRTQLRRIRDDDLAFCREEQYSGIVGVAAPIPSIGGNRIAAVGVCGPADRLKGRYLEEDIVGQVLSASKAVHVALTNDR